MAGDTEITVTGNLTADPELRFTPSGAAVANFTVASTPRAFDKNTNEWKDQETLFLRCNVWRDQAENVAESLQRGMRVIVKGRLQQRSYEKDGEKRTSYEMTVDEVGPSLVRASAQVRKMERQQQGQQPQQGGQQGGYGQPDPWATGGQQRPPQGQQGGGWQGNPNDEPPF